MIQVFDSRCPMIVDASEIRPGDWMRDLGRLRHVESVETTSEPILPSTLVRFSDDAQGRYGMLSIREGVTVTVWRTRIEAGGVHRGV